MNRPKHLPSSELGIDSFLTRSQKDSRSRQKESIWSLSNHKRKVEGDFAANFGPVVKGDTKKMTN